jgi:hypothetical protein
MDPTVRAASPVPAQWIALVLTLSALTTEPTRALARGAGEVPDGVVTEIKIEGNVEVETASIRRKIISRFK